VLLEELLGRGGLQDVEARQLESRGELGVGGHSVLLGLLCHQLHANQALADGLAILGGQIARGGFSVGQSLDHLVEQFVADGPVIDGDQRRLDRSGGRKRGRVRGGGLVAGGKREYHAHDQKTTNFHLISQGVE
jgi:hypothetical protein